MKSKVHKIIFIIIQTILLAGCWDKLEMEERAYVAAIGIDLADDNMYEVTYQLSNPQGGGFSNIIGNSQNEPEDQVITIKASDVLSARDTVNASITRRLTFSHINALIVSEDFAKSDRLLGVMETLLRDREVPRDIFLLVSKEKASDFINRAESKLETRPHKGFEFMAQRWRESSVVPISSLHLLMQRTEGGQSLFLGGYGTTNTENIKSETEADYLPGELNIKGANTFQIIGSAVFKDGKMIGVMDGEETRLSYFVQKNHTINSLFITFPDPLANDYSVICRLYKHHDVDLKVDVSSNTPVVYVKVPLEIYVIGIPSGINYVDDMNKQKLLEESIEKDLETQMSALLTRMKEEFKGEPFLWSIEARKKFRTFDEYMEYNWIEKFPQAKVTVKFDVTIEGFGKQTAPPKAIREVLNK